LFSIGYFQDRLRDSLAFALRHWKRASGAAAKSVTLFPIF
jgi:hypothetical protein